MAIEQINEEIAKIKRLIDQPENIVLEEHKILKDLLQAKEEKVRENDEMKNSYSAIIEKERILALQIKAMKEDEESLEKELTTIKKLIDDAKTSTTENENKKDTLSKNMEKMKADTFKNEEALEKFRAEVKALERESNEKAISVQKADDALKLKKESYHQIQCKIDTTEKDINNYQKQIEAIVQNVTKQNEDIVSLEIKSKEVAEDIRKTEKENSIIKHKINEIQMAKDESENIKQTVKTKIATKEAEVDRFNIELEANKKKTEEKMRMRELLNKKVVKAEDKVKREESIVKINENEKLKLENEDKAYRAEIAKLDKIINQLEEAKKKYGLEASQSNAKYYRNMEELKFKNDTITDLQRKNAETEAKYKQQQNLYEAVRTDRNLYLKNLNEARDEITELDKRYKQMIHQIDLLKEEIKNKDTQLLTVNKDLQNATKENESLQNDIENQVVRKNGSENMLKTHEIEITKLKGVIQQVEEERLKQKKDYDMVVSERDILGNQLIKRNEELVLLYEKIKIQQSTLAKGNIRYKEKCSDVEALQKRISEIKAEIEASNKEVDVSTYLKKEVHKLSKELIEERLKARALSDELSKPMNIHQWRQLEGTEPEIYQMLMKVHSLQRNLIAKTEELAEKDILIQEKEKLYVELKNILAKQSGPEVAEKLVLYQENLKERNKQLKQYVEELDVYRSQVNAYKFEIERINGEISSLKEKYFENKRKSGTMEVIPEEQKEAIA